MGKIMSGVFGFSGFFATLVSLYFVYDAYNVHQRFEMKELSLQAERSRSVNLYDEVSALRYKLSDRPTYLDGYRDAILRAGVPNSPGSYKDGFYAAFTMMGEGSFLDGMNVARAQFGLPQILLPNKETVGPITMMDRVKLLEEFEKTSPLKTNK